MFIDAWDPRHGNGIELLAKVFYQWPDFEKFVKIGIFKGQHVAIIIEINTALDLLKPGSWHDVAKGRNGQNQRSIESWTR